MLADPSKPRRSPVRAVSWNMLPGLGAIAFVADPGRRFTKDVSFQHQPPVWVFLAIFKGGFVEELWRVFGLTRFERLWGKSGLVIADI